MLYPPVFVGAADAKLSVKAQIGLFLCGLTCSAPGSDLGLFIPIISIKPG